MYIAKQVKFNTSTPNKWNADVDNCEKFTQRGTVIMPTLKMSIKTSQILLIIRIKLFYFQ